MFRRVFATLVVLTITLTSSPLAAQTAAGSETLSEILYELYLIPYFAVQEVSAGAATDEQIQRAQASLATPFLLNQTIINQLGTFPLGTSSGGFSYTFDPAIGTFRRSTQSFGPLFAERALTIGRHKVAVGGYYQHVTFDQVEGKSLQNGDLKFYSPFRYQNVDFVLGNTVKIDLSSDMVDLFANYGITDSLDVGVAIPIVRVDLKARLDSILYVADGRSAPLDAPIISNGTSSGLGDVILRAKYNVVKAPGGGVAAGVELRLPTGDEENLRGTGTTQTKLFVILSSAYAKVSPHVNAGYTFSKKSNSEVSRVTLAGIPDEINLTGGVDFAATQRLTIAGDLLLKSFRDAGRLKESTLNFGVSNFRELQFSEGSLNTTYGSLGFKVNAWRTLLLSGNLLFPLTKSGIRDKWTPVIGVDYGF